MYALPCPRAEGLLAPLSPAAATDWMLALLLAPSDVATQRLAERLQRDPALSLWALRSVAPACCASATFNALAEHLLASGPAALASLTAAAAPLPDAVVMAWADWLDQAAAVQHLLAAQGEPLAQTPACFLLLARNAPGFDETEDLPTGCLDTEPPPDWPQKLQFAQQQLGDNDQENTAVQAALRHASQCRNQFLARSPDAVPALRSLAEKLRERDRLRQDFAQQLEQEKLKAMKELAYGASHEINNPLANIATRAQMLLREETDPERRRKLATINSQAFRAHEMIANMMLFAHPPQLEPETFDLRAVIDQVLKELSPEADRQQIELEQNPRGEPLLLTGDKTHLAASLKALGQNALEAIGSTGRVVYSAQSTLDAAGDYGCEICVVDTGPGIPPEVRRHLFDPFYSGREAGRGLGFGLSKCWRVVELHGGRIEVETDRPEGAAFRIWLPLPPPENGQTAAPPADVH
ncbi:sensor histidine kinase [Lignipirellula cremea]|uniref:histidine kinase n=1 Tax=Lignipirellula cremea TaxID=2528010 RepID=A0A518DNY7_9BACT|nr:HAMP domain-containing sensor histidine kinase [Lignipirellula cremea]QDU93550.1 Sporulation kinase D [Lignipirellula cremea]